MLQTFKFPYNDRCKTCNARITPKYIARKETQKKNCCFVSILWYYGSEFAFKHFKIRTGHDKSYYDLSEMFKNIYSSSLSSLVPKEMIVSYNIYQNLKDLKGDKKK
jgi:hypothetical protein